MLEVRFPRRILRRFTFVVASIAPCALSVAGSSFATTSWQTVEVRSPTAYWFDSRLTVSGVILVPNSCYEVRIATDGSAYRYVAQSHLRAAQPGERCARVKDGVSVRGWFTVKGSSPGVVALRTSRGDLSVEVRSYASGPCDASDVLNLVAGPLKGAPDHAAALIGARLAACQDIIAKYLATLSTPSPLPAIAHSLPGSTPLPSLPTPSALPKMPEECTSPRSIAPTQQYAALAYCSGWIVRNVATQSPTPSPTPVPLAVHDAAPNAGAASQAIYVLALASDAPTSAQISLQLADDLRNKKYNVCAANGCPVNPYLQKAVHYEVIAEPTWTIAQYQQQCLADSTTAGAIVVLPPGVQSAAYNAVFSASWSALSLQALVLNCEPTNTAYVNNAAYITYVTHIRTATGHRYSLSLTTLLAGIAGYLALHPPKQETFALVSPYPTLPPGSYLNTGYTTNATTGGAAAVAAAAALGSISATNLGQNGGPDVSAQVAGAMAKVLPDLLSDLMAPCYPASKHDQRSNLEWVKTSTWATQCRWFAKPQDLIDKEAGESDGEQ